MELHFTVMEHLKKHLKNIEKKSKGRRNKMRLIDIDELRGCAIIRPISREEIGYILSCSNILIHDEIPTVYNKEHDKEIRDKAIDDFAKAVRDKIVAKYCKRDLTSQYIGMQTCDWIKEIAEKMKKVEK